MLSSTLLSYVHAEHFKAFRIIMTSGRQIEIRHPEFIRVGRDHFVYFHTSAPDEPHDRFETLSLLLVEDIQHINQPSTPVT